MKTIKFLSIIAVFAVIFNACTKQGATGPQGPAGPAGAAGASWTTNSLFYSFTVNASQWTYNSFGQDYYYNYAASIPLGTSNNGWLIGYIGGSYEIPSTIDGTAFGVINYLWQSSPQIEVTASSLPNSSENYIFYYFPLQ